MHKLKRDRFREADFTVDTLQVNVPELDPAFDNYRIVQITDIHLGHWMSPERLSGVVDMVNQLEADVVVITGDFARCAAKNGEAKAHMYTYMESGFVAQNLFLQAGALGLGAYTHCPLK